MHIYKYKYYIHIYIYIYMYCTCTMFIYAYIKTQKLRYTYTCIYVLHLHHVEEPERRLIANHRGAAQICINIIFICIYICIYINTNIIYTYTYIHVWYLHHVEEPERRLIAKHRGAAHGHTRRPACRCVVAQTVLL